MTLQNGGVENLQQEDEIKDPWMIEFLHTTM